MNGAEYRVFGLKRSGQHAVIGWIMAQSRGEAYFLGDVAPHTNPYRSVCDFEHWRDGHLVHRQGLYCPENRDAFMRGPYGAGARGSLQPVDVLLYNYEDQPVDQVLEPASRRRLSSWVGPSAQRFNIVVLRDPFNLLASRMRAGDRLASSTDDGGVTRIWKAHAAWCRGARSTGEDVNLYVNFSRWHRRTDYRANLAMRLGLTFTDAGRQRIPPYLGSSFDGAAFDGRADEMDVDRRWETYRQSDRLGRLREDATLVELVSELFQDIPEVQAALAG